ncbi:MAG: hypothetical protein NTW21_40900 [Verrucomicrobia bacterium]|nr:hypothetical protein [Verrucomicrobiota bacterium]
MTPDPGKGRRLAPAAPCTIDLTSDLCTLAISFSSHAAGDKWACPAVTPYRPLTSDL